MNRTVLSEPIYDSDAVNKKYVDKLMKNVKENSVYSDEEQQIGTWIDGKPIYRKVINFGALPNAYEKDVDHNISNLGTVVSASAISRRPSDNCHLILPLASTMASNSIYMLIVNGAIRIGTGSDRTAFTETYVTIEYTKTKEE